MYISLINCEDFFSTGGVVDGLNLIRPLPNPRLACGFGTIVFYWLYLAVYLYKPRLSIVIVLYIQYSKHKEKMVTFHLILLSNVDHYTSRLVTHFLFQEKLMKTYILHNTWMCCWPGQSTGPQSPRTPPRRLSSSPCRWELGAPPGCRQRER